MVEWTCVCVCGRGWLRLRIIICSNGHWCDKDITGEMKKMRRDDDESSETTVIDRQRHPLAEVKMQLYNLSGVKRIIFWEKKLNCKKPPKNNKKAEKDKRRFDCHLPQRQKQKADNERELSGGRAWMSTRVGLSQKLISGLVVKGKAAAFTGKH